jgi:5-methylthioadenosine/S-adenosylhomocysteine deaminase
MHPIDTLIEARWILPIRPRGAVLEHHAVAIDGGRIEAVLPAADARAAYAPARRVVLDRHALMPGLVNAHTHAAMALLRGVGDDMPLNRWLAERIWPLEQALVSPGFVYDGTRLAAFEMLRAGVTCCNDMYFFPSEAALALRAVGMRAVVGIIAIDFPSPYAADADDYLRKGLATRDALSGDPLLGFALAPHAPYTVGDATLARIATLAEEVDLPIHIHVHETEHEIEESLAGHGLRPLARLDRHGLVSERLIAVHSVHLDTSEIALLAQRGATAVHCPSSNLKLASGIAPVRDLLAAGANLAFGTDGAASNNRLDLLEETRLAALLAKGAVHDPTALPAWQALECATLGGAVALGLADRIGSIEPGKEADLAAVELSAAETQPCYDVVSQLVYCAGRENVTDVWVAGRHAVQTRQLLDAAGHDPGAEILAATAPWQNQIRQRLERTLK